ncbi:hypothetical protein BDY24DRAFT_375353, partial [Mrakia frigida]|uniref:uncharacterized protein n=1 Tax=Mrakia frigida TaxID=29902 RepID=UPI003FCBFBEC
MFLDDVRCGRRRGEPSSREESEKLSCKGRFLGRESRPRRGRGRGRGEVASGSRRVGGGDGSDGHVVGRFVRGEERLLRVVVVRSTTTTWRESRFELVESTLLDRGDSGVELGSLPLALQVLLLQPHRLQKPLHHRVLLHLLSLPTDSIQTPHQTPPLRRPPSSILRRPPPPLPRLPLSLSRSRRLLLLLLLLDKRPLLQAQHRTRLETPRDRQLLFLLLLFLLLDGSRVGRVVQLELVCDLLLRFHEEFRSGHHGDVAHVKRRSSSGRGGGSTRRLMLADRLASGRRRRRGVGGSEGSVWIAVVVVGVRFDVVVEHLQKSRRPRSLPRIVTADLDVGFLLRSLPLLLSSFSSTTHNNSQHFSVLPTLLTARRVPLPESLRQDLLFRCHPVRDRRV